MTSGSFKLSLFAISGMKFGSSKLSSLSSTGMIKSLLYSRPSPSMKSDFTKFSLTPPSRITPDCSELLQSFASLSIISGSFKLSLFSISGMKFVSSKVFSYSSLGIT